MSETKVENVKDFLDKLTDIQKNKSDNTELFFRGHADQAYEAEPTIFRKNGNGERNLLKNEKHLFNDMITQCPEDFKDCQYTFEHLVKMQHYGLPTRLLDITSNALVALYFACCSLNNFMCDENGEVVFDKKGKEIDQRKDGQVLVYAVRKDAIKNYNSDTVSILSNLAQLDNNFELFIARHYRYIEENSKLFDMLQKAVDDLERIRVAKRDGEMVSLNPYDVVILGQPKSTIEIEKDKEIELLSLIKANDYLRLLFFCYYNNPNISKSPLYMIQNKGKRQDITITESDKAWIEVCIKFIEKVRFLKGQKGRYFHFIKREKSYFIDKINFEDVQKIACVQAKLNNQRIIRQSGLFFLFGMGETKGKPIKFSDYIKLEYEKSIWEDRKPSINEITNPTIIIAAEKKADILKELRTLGISKETLMPEIDTVAGMLKERYN